MTHLRKKNNSAINNQYDSIEISGTKPDISKLSQKSTKTTMNCKTEPNRLAKASLTNRKLSKPQNCMKPD